MFSFWKWLTGSSSENAQARSSASGFGIKMTDEETEIERQKNALMSKFLEDSIINSGYFVPQKIPRLMNVLRDATHPFARSNTKAAQAGNSLLSKEEKIALGLNPRMKYTREFIDYFERPCLRDIEPKGALEKMHINAFHRASRHFEIIKLKELGFVKRVVIHPTDGCNAINRLKKTYNIDEIPELPLKGCDTECLCYYELVIPNDFT